jgi:hypothetical protein
MENDHIPETPDRKDLNKREKGEKKGEHAEQEERRFPDVPGEKGPYAGDGKPGEKDKGYGNFIPVEL